MDDRSYTWLSVYNFSDLFAAPGSDVIVYFWLPPPFLHHAMMPVTSTTLSSSSSDESQSSVLLVVCGFFLASLVTTVALFQALAWVMTLLVGRRAAGWLASWLHWLLLTSPRSEDCQQPVQWCVWWATSLRNSYLSACCDAACLPTRQLRQLQQHHDVFTRLTHNEYDWIKIIVVVLYWWRNI